MDPQPAPLRQDEQLGVEEPGRVLDEREQLLCHVRPDRLEAALRVGEPGAQGTSQDEVVAPRDHLTLEPAHDPGSPREPGPDGEVRVARHQRRHQRPEGVEVRGQVDVHVGQDRRVRGEPDLLERSPTTLLRHPDNGDPRQLLGEGSCVGSRRVRAGVVGHRHPEGVREGVDQVGVQPTHARRHRVLLVVDRDDDVEDRGGHGVLLRWSASSPRCRSRRRCRWTVAG
jgi:hypothetical protein